MNNISALVGRILAATPENPYRLPVVIPEVPVKLELERQTSNDLFILAGIAGTSVILAVVLNRLMD